MMDLEYKQAIIDCAKEKLETSERPLADAELLRGIIALLKKKYGKDDKRHSSKTRFRSEYYNSVIITDDWRSKIVLQEDKKYITREKYKEQLIVSRTRKDSTEGQYAIIEIKEILISKMKNMDPYEFEHLVKNVFKSFYPDYAFNVTKRSGDLGVDVIGITKDRHRPEKNKVIYIQAKRYSKSADRSEADKFIGSLGSYINEKGSNVSKFSAYFVSTDKFSLAFKDRMNAQNADGRNYEYWDGEELVNKLISFGLGVTYVIDMDYWENMDFSATTVVET